MKAFTLLEIVIVIAVLGILLSAIFGVLASSRKDWQSASEQIDRQQDARKAVDRITWELKSSNPSWNVNATLYNISINSAGDQVDFFVPIFDTNNQITTLRAVRYYVGGLNNAQLLRKEGSIESIIANNIDNVAGQKPFFTFGNTNNTIVDIKIPIIKNNAIFVLESQSNLRNRQANLTEGVIIENILEQ